MAETVRKGRHRILSNDVILQAAFEAFASEGYDTMSVRKLNVELGLSHETVRQRFGSKNDLFRAAVDLAVATFYSLLSDERVLLGEACGDVEELRLMVRAFITASIKFPQLANLVNHEAGSPNERIDYIFSVGFSPGMALFGELLERLAADGVIYPISIRDAFFLVDAGMSPFAQVGLSRAFDELAGPLDLDTHVDDFIAFIFRGLLKPPLEGGR